MIHLIVPGKPIPQPRTANSVHGGRYTPDNGIKGYRAHIAMLAKRAGAKPVEGPIAMTIRIVFQRPKSHFKKNGTLRDTAPQYPTKKLGDTGNIVKGIEDALNKVAYNDDSQIVEQHLFKYWGGNAFTEIIIH
jgi:Holliday junction resolvase RusA-like endonuclease